MTQVRTGRPDGMIKDGALLITPDTEVSDEEYDEKIMLKIHRILAKGNNAEIKLKSDGTIAVMEVKKQIV